MTTGKEAAKYLLAYILVCLMIGLAVVLKGQDLEQGKSKTVSWTVFSLPTQVIDYYTYDPILVNVIDAGSVCIYISRNALDHGSNMEVVPKSQLPQGRGCQ